MSIQSSTKEKTEFRRLILHLKKFNPSWKAKEITRFVIQSENPPQYTTSKALWMKISRILKRDQVDDLPRSGAPCSTTTIEYTQAVRENIRLKKNPSIRKVNAILDQNGYATSKSSVWRTKNPLNLKWWKLRTVQKLTTDQKAQRVTVAKRLRKKYGVKKDGKSYKWNYILNTDFSGTFSLNPRSNQHNEGVYAELSSDIPYDLKTKAKEKFQKNIILWGGISYRGLFPKQSPIFVDEWLELIRPQGSDRRKKMYFTGESYATFIQTVVAAKARHEFGDMRDVIFHDDQDKKQRTRVALEVVGNVFSDRIEPIDCNAKLADVWPIERVWGVLKEKLRGREYISFEELKKDIKKEWTNFGVILCQRMIDEIPPRLKLVIDGKGNQIHGHP